MAPGNATPVILKPEQRLARLFSARHSLELPVDVEALVGKFADVEYAHFPTTCDALLVHGTPRSRVILSNNLRNRKQRRRFTLAHELAHLTIPWQAGTFFCHADALRVTATETIGQQLEAEANRFASELLVPGDWMSRVFVEADEALLTPAQVVAVVAEAADVSIGVALFAACTSGPPGVLLALVDGNQSVQYASVSPGTYCSAPARNTSFDSESFSAAGGLVAQMPLDIYTIYSVDFRSATAPSERPAEVSLDILREILSDVQTTDEQKRAMSSSLNGVIGALNNRVDHLITPQDVVAALKQRLIGRANLALVMEHRRFADFLVAKAHELIDRRGK